MPIECLKQNDFRRRVVAGSFSEYHGLQDALRGMQFVQADPIRAPARAQDLILRQRLRGYQAGELEERFPILNAEEGYLFAYGFMTRDVWECLRWRARGKLKKLERDILAMVGELGEAHPRELDERFGRKSATNYWGGKSRETKRILENLHHHGYLRVARREKGIRVYQVPNDTAPQKVDPIARYRELALTTARAFGPTTRRFLLSELRSQNHLLPDRKDRLEIVDSFVELGELTEFAVNGINYLWDREAWTSDDIPDRIRILAPFDPLVRDRDRFSQLFDWDYRFEAYLPANKRQRGYYAMPLLWRDKVIGWANAKVDNMRLNVEFGFVGSRPRAKTFRLAMEAEVESLTTFLGLKSGAWNITTKPT